jgi:hypothetical protein
MYFFVPYNISDIQKGIQAGHAALEYAHTYDNTPEYRAFIENDKTWIILNGGTTSCVPPIGDMNNIWQQLNNANIHFSCFHEKDLNDALTAICFIADERVWDFENYPDYDGNVYEKSWVMRMGAMPALQIEPEEIYKDWVEFIGGDKNVFLRSLIRDKSLA